MFSVLPCIVMLVAPKEIPRKVLPAMAKDSEGMFEDLMRYVLAGLEALAKAHRAAPAPSPSGRGRG